MTVRGLAWINCVGLMVLAWLSSAMSRTPLSTPDQIGRFAVVFLTGFAFVGFCVLLARRAPLASKVMLGLPLVVVSAFIVGLLGAALIGSL